MKKESVSDVRCACDSGNCDLFGCVRVGNRDVDGLLDNHFLHLGFGARGRCGGGSRCFRNRCFNGGDFVGKPEAPRASKSVSAARKEGGGKERGGGT
jgi:hypothetical protein